MFAKKLVLAATAAMAGLTLWFCPEAIFAFLCFGVVLYVLSTS